MCFYNASKLVKLNLYRLLVVDYALCQYGGGGGAYGGGGGYGPSYPAPVVVSGGGYNSGFGDFGLSEILMAIIPLIVFIIVICFLLCCCCFVLQIVATFIGAF